MPRWHQHRHDVEGDPGTPSGCNRAIGRAIHRRSLRSRVGARPRQPPGGHPVRSRYGRSWARRFGGAIARFDGAQGSACLSPWNAQGRHEGEKLGKRAGRRKTSRGLFRKLRRANVRIGTGRQGWRAAAGHAPKPCSEGRPRTHRTAARSGALLRPALRFQGPGQARQTAKPRRPSALCFRRARVASGLFSAIPARAHSV